MKDQKNLAVCVVVDAKFLFKYFKNFINSLELKGKYKGDIVVITSWFTPTFLLFKTFNKNIKIYRFRRIKFTKKTENYLKSIPSLPGAPNRHITKNFQWHKLHLFNEKLKKWKYIFYLDVNMIIHSDINPLLQKKMKDSLLARADAFPSYDRTLNTQFYEDSQFFNQLKTEYDLSSKRYFQTGLMLFDTNIIKPEMFNDLIRIVEKYPCSKTNEQGILNLYFLKKPGLYVELPSHIDENLLTYNYWRLEDKLIIITKQNVEQYK